MCVYKISVFIINISPTVFFVFSFTPWEVQHKFILTFSVHLSSEKCWTFNNIFIPVHGEKAKDKSRKQTKPKENCTPLLLCFFLFFFFFVEENLECRKPYIFRTINFNILKSLWWTYFPTLFCEAKEKNPIVRSCCTLLFVYITPSA